MGLFFHPVSMDGLGRHGHATVVARLWYCVLHAEFYILLIEACKKKVKLLQYPGNKAVKTAQNMFCIIESEEKKKELLMVHQIS